MPEISEFLLMRFFHGKCTEREAELVLKWLLDPQNRRLAREMMQRQWDNISGEEVDIDVETLLFRTRDELSLGKTRGDKSNPKWYETVFFRIAASFLFMVVSFAALWLTVNNEEKPELSLVQEALEVSTSTGQVILKILPDGTKVWLNAKSKLIYPENFGRTRDVTLEGEAFFDVAEDEMHPFVVHADDIIIRVLGTAFNVKSYRGDPSIATTLVRGKVLIEKRENDVADEIELKPNEQAIFSHESKDISLVRVNATRFSSWTNGSLVFEDDRVDDVFRTLERWYGVKIRVEDGLDLSCRLTARIDKESLTETLELLKSITGIRFGLAGDEVTIEGNVCTP